MPALKLNSPGPLAPDLGSAYNRNMSPTELLFALLLVAIVAGVAGVAALVQAAGRRTEVQARELAELREQLATGGLSQDAHAAELRARLSDTQSAVESFKSTFSARQQIEDEARQSLRRLEAIIAGSSTRGAAGENILEEGIRHLPPAMVQRDAWINGKVVEFALRLPGGKLLPVDSKWTSTQALEELSADGLEPVRRAQLAAQVQKEVEKRSREVAQYIDPASTSPWAVASVPDAAYAVCRSAFADAHRRNVVIVSYSMTLPYLLALYQLHLQFARSVDMENLQACLIDIDRQLDSLEQALENKLQRAVVMLQNAYGEARQVSARVRASTHAIQITERLEPSGDGRPADGGQGGADAPAAPQLELVEAQALHS
jgi:DNA recombination protein RmuC